MFIETGGGYPYPVNPYDVCEAVGWKDWHELMVALLKSGVIGGSTFLDILDANDRFTVNPNA